MIGYMLAFHVITSFVIQFSRRFHPQMTNQCDTYSHEREISQIELEPTFFHHCLIQVP